MRLIGMLAATLCVAPAYANAQAASLPGVYTEAQAARGKQTYDRYCSQCHAFTLRGTGHGPDLVGKRFLSQWGERTAGELTTYIRKQMSSTLPRSTSAAVYPDLAAHILRVNGSAAGDTELATDSSVVVGPAVMGAQWNPALVAAGSRDEASRFQSWEGADSIAAAAQKAGGFVNRELGR